MKKINLAGGAVDEIGCSGTRKLTGGGGGEVWICIFLLSCCHHLGVDQYDYDDQEG